MKKLYAIILLSLTLLCFTKVTYAFEPNSNSQEEVSAIASQVNMTIVNGESTNIFGSNWYRFTISFLRQGVTFHNLMFGHVDRVSANPIIMTTNSTETVLQVLYDTSTTFVNNKYWSLYLGTSGTYIYAYVYSSVDGATAEATLQSLIDSSYIYFKTASGVSKGQFYDAFFNRYVSADTGDAYTSGYNAGYTTGYNIGIGQYEVGYEQGYNTGYSIGYDDGAFEVEQLYIDVVLESYDDGYAQGFIDGNIDASDFAWTTTMIRWLGTAFASFASIEIVPDLSLGMIMAVPLVLGILTFIVGVAKANARDYQTDRRNASKSRERRSKS